jgi:hypothetical protein
MFKYVDRYINWTYYLEPSWLGTVMFLWLFLAASVIVSLALVIFAVLTFITNGWALLAIPAFALYTVYLALNQ